MPGYKVYLQDGGEIREGLTCCYCRLLLKDPVQTSESGLRLCKECYEKASKLVLLLIHSHVRGPKPFVNVMDFSHCIHLVTLMITAFDFE